ncbi:MAG: HAD hydrolase-like protein, partial [Candidatus Omnitrophica bacterium]|nr:HAD hydrolase-like protein [Candidatus Omnitrophota bacterium]
MKKQLLLFDFDGTIADTFHHIIEISNRLAAEFSFNLIQPH